jgi:PHD/YefM family antitoxin component YafN of YafNO toxin-antitoxin module
MAIPADTFTTYSVIGMREDLKDFIANVSPKDVPFQNMAGKGKAENTFFEWQTDVLAAATTNNAQLEGDDYAAVAVTPTVRLGNRCQISSKSFTITGTMEATTRAGRGSEVAYQLTKQTYELKRDMEAILTGSQASNAGNSTTARRLGSLENQITTNASINGDTGGGYSASNWAAVVDGTQRPFTETLLKDVCQQVFTNGGNPNYLMVGPVQKQVVSGFTGNATRMDKSEDQKLYTAIDVYVSDFFEFKVVPNRFQRNRTAFLLQSDMWHVMYLRPVQVQDLAKTGDSMKKLVTVEYSLMGKNQRASGVIRSLT